MNRIPDKKTATALPQTIEIELDPRLKFFLKNQLVPHGLTLFSNDLEQGIELPENLTDAQLNIANLLLELQRLFLQNYKLFIPEDKQFYRIVKMGDTVVSVKIGKANFQKVFFKISHMFQLNNTFDYKKYLAYNGDSDYKKRKEQEPDRKNELVYREPQDLYVDIGLTKKDNDQYQVGKYKSVDDFVVDLVNTVDTLSITDYNNFQGTKLEIDLTKRFEPFSPNQVPLAQPM